jgi:uncharacterized protein Yka (UPF0111/DUF47 family)
MKSKIISRLGQGDILLPSLIAEGLAANDRVKARLSALQAAAGHAREPQRVCFNLANECRAVGVDPAPLETLVNNASLAGEKVTAPGLGDLTASIWDDVATMARAVSAGEPAVGEAALKLLSAQQTSATPEVADTIALSQIGKLTEISDSGDDTLHRLVMDLHKALNRLSAAHAEEILDGAHVYRLTPDDRTAVAAFMRGVESTRKLKFDHPGLSTTATRAGARLAIQNDIGETDAHVVVVTVEADAITVIYTDVHLARTKFLINLFRNFSVQWSGLDRKSADGLGDDGVFYLVTGRFPAGDAERRNVFLEAVGASLVFLIDWNKARKLLQTWVSKGDAVRILDWAARHRVGHRAFLELGGSELVASAVHNSAPARIGFGDRLDHVLGRESAIDFLKTVLRVSTDALLEGGSVRLARDRIEANLVRHLQRVEATLLAIVVRQAGLAREIAAGVAQFIAQQQAHRPFDRSAFAGRARRIEEKADRIIIETRGEIARFDANPAIERLANHVEEAIDELEQAAFISSLIPGEIAPELLVPLAELCAAGIDSAEAAAVGVAAASDVPDGHSSDSEDALAAVARLIDAEHRADAAERAVTAIVLRGKFDLQAGLSVLELTRAIERATDRLAGLGHLLREHVLADLAA